MSPFAGEGPDIAGTIEILVEGLDYKHGSQLPTSRTLRAMPSTFAVGGRYGEQGTREMTDVQLYLAIGVPSFVVLMGMLMNGLLFLGLNSRMTALEGRMANLENTFTTRFDLLMGRLIELEKEIHGRQ